MAKHSHDPDDREENLLLLKEEFEKLQKKYSLPKFEELDEEFEIRKIDYDLFLVKEIRRAVMQKLDFMVAVLEPILNPSSGSLHSYVETKIFSKHNVEPMLDFYKKVWALMHKAIYVAYLDEKAEAAWINEVWKEWPSLKKQAAGYSKQIAEGWANVEKEVFSEKYLQ